MHKVQFPATFISAYCPTKGQTTYYVVNLMAADGNIDRFFITQEQFHSLDAAIIGDKFTVSARLFYAPKNSSWALKIDSLIPTI